VPPRTLAPSPGRRNASPFRLIVSITDRADRRRNSQGAQNMNATRKLVAILTLGAATLGLAGHTASAQTVSPGGTLTAYASCNRSNHTMTMQGSLILSTRFPKGAYVATRYAYYYVNSALQPISPTYTTGWLYSNVPASTRWINPDVYLSNISAPLPAYTFSTNGQLRAMAQVGVWNGTAYEYSNWDVAPSYENWGPMGSYTVASSCWASLT
jgi:hypothetical protein